MEAIARVGFKEHKVMITQASSKVGHPRIGVGSTPAWVGKESINPFLDEIIDIPPIGLSKLRSNKPHINHVVVVETFFE